MLAEDLLSINLSGREPFLMLAGFSHSCHAIIMLASIKCHRIIKGENVLPNQ